MKKSVQLLLVSAALFGTISTSATIAKAQRANDPKSAAKYLSAHEGELSVTPEAYKKIHLLLQLAPAALTAGDQEKARSYATELISLGESQRYKIAGFGPSLYSDARHIGNMILGQQALAIGDLVNAKAHLLAAGEVPGSSVLISFGPNMLLAKQLLEKGEQEAVIQYLDYCAQFWEMHRGRLDQWKETIKQGAIPEFGSNLTVGLSSWRFDKRPD
jgi:hypothetical protein